jgi:hypothetical protein
MSFTQRQLREACDALVESGDVEAFKEKYAKLKQDLDQIFLGNWHYDDIRIWFDDRYAEDYEPLSDKDIEHIAYLCEKYFDAEHGMNWTVLDSHMWEVLVERAAQL